MRSRNRLVMAAGLIGLVLATVLATQHFLLAPLFSATTSGIQANCATIFEDSSDTPVTPASGTILFGCSARSAWPPTWLGCPGSCPSAYPALNVSQPANYAAVFKLPQYYTGLFVANTNGCSPPAAYGPPPAQLTNGTEIRLSGSSSSPSFYYYCARYASVALTGFTLSGFTISWGSGSRVFSQTFPSVTVPAKPVFSGCGTTVIDSVTPVTPVNGVLEFECMGGGSPYPAFAVLVAGYYTPIFTLSQYYTRVSITPIADFVSNCAMPASGHPPPTPITSGTQVYLTPNPGSGGYCYCASYASVPAGGGTLPSFTVSWSSGSTVLLQTIPSVPVPAKTSAIAVVRGIDNVLYYATLAGSWSGWQSLGGSTSGPALFCSGGSGSLYLAVRASDNVTILVKSYSNGVWSAWAPIPGGGTNAEPGCASMNGLLYVLARGQDYSPYYNILNETSGSWRGWKSMGGSFGSSPALAPSPSRNRLDVVVEGATGDIYHTVFISGVWSQKWQPLNGTTSDVPAVSSDGLTLHVVVRGGDNGVYYNALNFTSNVWSVWVSLVGTTSIAPSLATDSSGTVHLFVVGTYGTIYDKSLAAGGVWSTSWDNSGGTASNPVAVTTQGPNILIMVSGTNGAIWYNTLSASAWQGWTPLGGSTALEPALSNIS